MNSCCVIGGIARNIWDKISCRKKPKKSIVLLVAGLDNAGKSAVVDYLFNKSLVTEENMIPTIGFRTVAFNYKSCSIRLYDVGGGPQIRALWPKYYADVHGVIYVVDSNDVERFDENAKIFQELVCHEMISQKPILFLGNKQDLPNAVDEIDLIEIMNIEQVVNFVKCYTRVEICSCFPDKSKKFNLNKNIDTGFKWLIETICQYYEPIEREMGRRVARSKRPRSFKLKSWAAPRVDNPFYYSDTDSETYMKPIAPKDTPPRKRKKRKSLKSVFSLTNNRTAPMPGNGSGKGNNGDSTETTRELIRSIKIEVHSLSAPRRTMSYWKKRPDTAPAAAKPFAVVNPIARS